MSIEWSDVLVDVLNTTPVVDGANTDLLETDADARDWLRAHAGDGTHIATARRVRDDLQQVVRGHADAEVLNRYLARVRRVPRVHDDGLDWELVAADWPAQLVLAWGEVQSIAPGRLRPCANGECHLFLLDRSRGGTGRWCSMSECGNRMKARRHYSRTAGKAD
ncbi:CGNR zinc finger domain-containing protein [Mycolicibacterium komossense]|uniref:CGNR zinc finger domain-containing protein n=1 Tax=Mycolicibacterium komossense TaxID=1779 RepID=A0ABT3CCX2_9MYCO|nr:CGNR zinc finger domain-containing protein [Mycolicibacterium komossense]MCV7227349.1 CGNR zinc finger domain-containing protein [Mycolicibacterium komossense]